jgi:hypothetical protein
VIDHDGSGWTEAEFRAALRKIGDGKSAADAQVPAEYYKALEEEATRRSSTATGARAAGIR